MSCRIQITFTDGNKPINYFETVTEDLEKAQQFADRYIGFHRKKKDGKDSKGSKDSKDDKDFRDKAYLAALAGGYSAFPAFNTAIAAAAYRRSVIGAEQDGNGGKDSKNDKDFCKAFNKMWRRKSVKAMMEEAKMRWNGDEELTELGREYTAKSINDDRHTEETEEEDTEEEAK